MVLVLTAGSASALPLGLKPNPAGPDIYNAASINYSHLTQTFSATIAGALGLVKPAGLDIFGLTYNVNAQIDNTGQLNGGTVSIFGEISDLGIGPSTLVTGDLKKFGYDTDAGSSYGNFEFLFEVTGANPLGFGTKGGIILTSFDFSGGDFATGFSAAGGMTTSDTYSVPEPATLLLFGLGAGAVAIRRRRAAGAR